MNTGKIPNELLPQKLRRLKRMLLVCFISIGISIGANIYFVVDRVQQRQKTQAFSYFKQSDALTRVADWKGTLALAKERQKTHPDDADAYWFEGVAQFNHGRWVEAINAINRAVELNPEKWRPMSSAWLVPAQWNLRKESAMFRSSTNRQQ